jgi:hypothetical protein
MRVLLLAVALGLTGLILVNSDFNSTASAQQTPDPHIQAKHAIGEVKSIDAPSKLVTIKTDAGSVVMVLYTDRTTYKKLAPGETSLEKATDITFADVAEGDRILARGTVAEDKKSLSAQQIVVMTKGDLAKKQEDLRVAGRLFSSGRTRSIYSRIHWTCLLNRAFMAA